MIKREIASAWADMLFGGYPNLVPSEATRNVFTDMFREFQVYEGHALRYFVGNLHLEFQDACPTIGQVMSSASYVELRSL